MPGDGAATEGGALYMVTRHLDWQSKPMELREFNRSGADDGWDEEYALADNRNNRSLATQALNTCSSCNSFLRTTRGYTFVLLLLTTICLFADQNIMAPNLSQIAEEFEISDEERDARLGGDVSVAFFVVGGPVGIVAGWYTDRYPRNIMYGTVALIGSLGSFLTFCVTSHATLLMARAVTGISIGGASPILFSMLSDLFSVDKRNLVVALVGFSISLGSMLGQAMSAAVGISQGWKMPFLYVSIPTCVLSLLVLKTTQDPPRASQELSVQRRVSLDAHDSDFAPVKSVESGSLRRNRSLSIDEMISDGTIHVPKYEAKASLKKLKDLFKTKTNVLLFLQGIPGCVPWGIIFAFMTDYLHNDRNATIMEATSIIISWNMGQLLVGQSIGGFIGQFMYNRSKPSLCWLMGVTTMVGSVPMLYLINSPFQYSSFLIVSFIGGAVASVTGANIKAVVLNCNVPEMRGVANGVFGLTDDLGMGFGPLLISGLESVTGGRQAAFTVGTLFWLLCGGFICMISFTLEADERLVLKHVEDTGRAAKETVDVENVAKVGLLQG